MIEVREVVQWLSLIVLITSRCARADDQPHVVFILADDLGWNDVGFHGSGQIPTPNIDALAYSGLILDRYYVSPICTPSRSAIMTGKHAIRTGMQHGVLKCAEPRGLPLHEKLLPEYLSELGYSTHIVGKWHLGFYTKEYTPTYRGFDSHLGFWSGHHDYFDHSAVESPYWGLDMRRGLDPAWDLHGQYSTDIFTKEAEKLIDAHNTSRPMFLYLAHAAVHSGNPYNPLPAPDHKVAKFNDISDYNRRRFAGMLTVLDESIGRVVDALRKKGMLQNSIIIFSTDNGGAPSGFNQNAASNWPLKGGKNTLWEGGVRGAGLIWSAKRLKHHGAVSKTYFHVTDWLPTLMSAVGGNQSNLHDIDGFDMWQALRDNTQGPRNTVLHNIDDIFGVSAITVGEWKLMQGTTYAGQWDGWFGPSGRDTIYDVGGVTGSAAGRAAVSVGLQLKADDIRRLRSEVTIECSPKNETVPRCKPLEAPCLFNVINDPCETVNLATKLPTIVSRLQAELQKLNATAIPPGNLPWDDRANPALWDHVWLNFGDYLNNVETASVGAM
ncbi:arylsulfatase B [Halictus rubicundus]|uniref:arylsulfatase B n=1 Tax=Halictus rubicundus TaxID=77578 RepID=UPI0040355D1B